MTTVLAGHRIGGELVAEADPVTSTHRAPWNQEELFEVPDASTELIDRALQESVAAFRRHRARRVTCVGRGSRTRHGYSSGTLTPAPTSSERSASPVARPNSRSGEVLGCSG